MPSNESSPPPTLLRAVSRWQVLGLSINDVVGSGIYLLPMSAALLLGPASPWAVLVAGVAVALLVLCYAQAASWFDQPGGAYLYAREAFGPFVGFQIGWMTWLTRIAVAAALSNGFALALATFVPALAEGAPRIAVVVGVLVFATLVNVIGVRSGARTAIVLVVGKLVPLLVFVALGAWHVDTEALRIETWPPLDNLGKAALLLLFAYAGFENSPAAAGEYRDPRRDLPAALVRMIVIVTLLYLGVQVVALGTLPGLATAKAPLAEAMSGFAGMAGVLLVGAGATISILGTLSTTMLFGPRFLYAMARDGHAPGVLARVHPRFRTPYVAILVQAALSIALALSGSFVELALLSMVARLCAYMGTAASVLRLRKRFATREGALVLPGGALIPSAALLLAFVLLLSAEPKHLAAGALALVVGALVYAWQARRA